MADEPEIPATHVAIFDPAQPSEPVALLRGNFDPTRHVRWEQRPSNREVDFAAAAGINKAQAKALRAAGVLTLGQLSAVKDPTLRKAVGVEAAERLRTWLRAHPHLALVESEAKARAAARERAEEEREEAEAPAAENPDAATIVVPLAADALRHPEEVLVEPEEAEDAEGEASPAATTPPSGSGPEIDALEAGQIAAETDGG